MEPTARPARAALYVRVHRTCPDDIRRWVRGECEAFARAHKLDPILVLEEEVDHSDLDGPELTTLRDAVQYRLVDAVVAVHLGRWEMALRDLEVFQEEFAEAGVDLYLLPYAARVEPLRSPDAR